MYDGVWLKELREKWGFTQEEMGELTGYPLRGYQRVEASGVLNTRHVMLVQYASLKLAIERKDAEIALTRFLREVARRVISTPTK